MLLAPVVLDASAFSPTAVFVAPSTRFVEIPSRAGLATLRLPAVPRAVAAGALPPSPSSPRPPATTTPTIGLATTNVSPTRRIGSTTVSRYVPGIVRIVTGASASISVPVAPGSCGTGWPSTATCRFGPRPVPAMVSTPVSSCTVTRWIVGGASSWAAAR